MPILRPPICGCQQTFQNFLKIEENADGRHENFVFFFFLNIAINNSELLFAIDKKY
jgi:hypothetical protein